MSTPRIVGAYAALPAERSDQEEFYRLLADRGVTGIEIPYANALHDDLDWFAERIAPFGNSVVTAIPGTMGRVGQDPEFGLASTTTGRDRGLAFIAQILADIEKLHDKVGPVVRWLQVHSAPSDQCDAEAFATSLAQVCHWADSLDVTPVVEHCDARGHHEGEKRFLSFEEELEVCQALDVRMTINWGRSVLETHDPATLLSHVRALVDAGLLGGLMFSGIGP